MKFLSDLSPEYKRLALILGILIFAFVFNRLVLWLMNRSFTNASEKLKVDPTRYRFFKNAVSLIIGLVAIAAVIYLVPKLRALAIALFAGAGVFLAILGFAAQQAFSNIISGIFIVIFRPFRVGDLIRIGSDYYGTIEDITLRHTVITNFENRRIIIPNSVISSETLVNSSIGDEKICEFIVFGISYESNIDQAMDIMREQAEKHPLCIDNRTDQDKAEGLPVVQVFTIGFGDSSVNLRATVWSSNPLQAREMHFDLNKSIKERFDQEGIEIPYPHRTVTYKNTREIKSKS